MLVVNPRATRVRAGTIGRVEAAFPPGMLVKTVVPDGRPGMQRAMQSAVTEHGATAVAVLGGDGTIGLAAGELAGTPTGLIPLPGGSTNVFARGLGWPATPTALAEHLEAALRTPPRTVRLGSVGTDRGTTLACVNVGAGIDAAVVDWVEHHPRVKQRLRHLAFAGATVGPGLGHLRRARPLHVAVGDGPGVEIHGLVGAWGRPYAYVGPRALDLLPTACWDGRLAWMALTRGTVRQLAAVVRTGLLHPGNPVAGTIGGTTAGPVTVTSVAPFPVQSDGEPLGVTTRLVLRPGPPLEVRVPQAFAATCR